MTRYKGKSKDVDDVVFSPRPMLWAMPLVQISAALGCQATVAHRSSDVACSDKGPFFAQTPLRNILEVFVDEACKPRKHWYTKVSSEQKMKLPPKIHMEPQN